jgi:toxin YoeB
MIYKVFKSENADRGIEEHKKSGQKILVKKIASFLLEIKSTPRTGTGKPEHLKHYDRNGIEIWSRRINDKHRFVYTIDDENKVVEVWSVYGHYGDK